MIYKLAISKGTGETAALAINNDGLISSIAWLDCRTVEAVLSGKTDLKDLADDGVQIREEFHYLAPEIWDAEYCMDGTDRTIPPHLMEMAGQ